MKKTIGILAHVDAGKTTLSERILYEAQAIRKLGRVDHQDAFLDNDPIERKRGITIFSGQAYFQLGSDEIYWVDTPGHVDFSPEMERALSILDYAILVVSSAEGIQSHTETLWALLKDYHIPTVIFLSKTDREQADPDRVLAELKQRLSSNMLDFRHWQQYGQPDDALAEELASGDELLMELYLNGEAQAEHFTAAAIMQLRNREITPVFAGSALTGNGMQGFLSMMNLLTKTQYEDVTAQPLSARVYQIRHDPSGQRICFMKLLTGTLHVKDALSSGKVNEIRVYHGSKYHSVDTACAGDLIAVPGMEELHAGSMIGLAAQAFRVEPLFAADLIWDRSAIPTFRMHQWLKELEDEEPTLSVEKREDVLTIHMMGKIQLEILQQVIRDRFGAAVSFGPCKILYKETVAAPVLGVGHYEPLRHYAEVHVRLVPTEPGTGIAFRTLAHVDELALNWQRLIETHVLEKQHKGVLTGSPVTDLCVELIRGRAHLKHTEGGDFRQATYRAIRNALMHAESVLLEPVCRFQLRFPTDCFGSISSSLQRISALCEPADFGDDGFVSMQGEAPLNILAPWLEDYPVLTHGKGVQRSWLVRYAPCADQGEITAQSGYNPLADDTPDSVFCSHGAGYTVPWDEVAAHAHLPVGD